MSAKENQLDKKLIAQRRAAKKKGRLYLPENIKNPNTCYRFAKDSLERIAELEGYGYSVVNPSLEKNKALAIHFGCSNGETKIVRIGEQGSVHILMEISKELYDAGIEYKDQENKKSLEAIYDTYANNSNTYITK